MDVIKVFYDEIVPEAMVGKINVYLDFSVAFSTKLVEEGIDYPCNINAYGTIIPILIIKNKKLFDNLLNEYVIRAMDFYDNSSFYDEVLNYKNKDGILVGKEKLILMQLFTNATVEDFNDPISFLKKRIAFIDNHVDKSIDLGYSETLGANLELITMKDTLNNETPSEFLIRATDSNDIWISPRVKYGIDGDTVYIYAIQNANKNNGNLTKRINRKLYKVGEGFIDKGGEENPKDVTASFLVTLNMAISYFRSLGYEKIIVPSILPVRWNVKKIIFANKHKRKKITDEKFEILNSELDVIQSNLTNKLIRTFLRLTCHYNNFMVDSFPYELDSALHMYIDNEKRMICNNKLLLETNEMVSSKSNNLTK